MSAASRRGSIAAGVGLALLATACQLVAPQPPPQPRLLIDRAAIGTPVAKPAGVDLTYTVKRGTIRETIVLPGRVTPPRAAQLSFRTPGTISAVHVRSGQEVRQGDPLVELEVDEEALRQARAQATLAELAAESQAARVRELQAGAGPTALAAARAEMLKARLALLEAEQARAALDQAEGGDELRLAELAVEQARDDLTQAEAAADRHREQVQLDAQAAAAAVRSAERRLAAARLKLEQVQASTAVDEAARAVAVQQLAVDQARDDLAQAQAAEQRAENRSLEDELGMPLDEAKDIPLRLAQARLKLAREQASAAARAAWRRLATESARLDQLRAARALAEADHQRELKLAQLELDEATDALAQAQAAERRAREGRAADARAQAPAGAAADPSAAVRAARRKLEMELTRYRAMQARLEAAAVAQQAATRLADLRVEIAREALALAQAREQDVREGVGEGDLQREQARLALLRDEADAARRAASPVVTLAAPFDGTVASVEVSPGQQVEPRATVVRLAGQGRLSVVASASEVDVTQLRLDRTVEVTFPGLPDRAAAARIVDISEIASVVGERVTYPVRLELASVPDGLKLGMSAEVNVHLREARDALYVPLGALRTASGRSVVTRIEPSGQVSEVPVQAGGTYGSNVEILSGLAEGDVVAVFTVTDGVPRRR